jgi:hypothetical protein
MLTGLLNIPKFIEFRQQQPQVGQTTVAAKFVERQR